MRNVRRFLVLFLSFIFCINLFIPSPVLPSFAAEPENIALGQRITATSSYVPPEGFFSAEFLIDGQWATYDSTNVKLGWNSDVFAPTAEDTVIDITISLDTLYTVEKIILKPMQWNNGDGTPRDFQLQFSKDGNNWNTVVSEKDVNTHASSNTSVKPLEYSVTPTDTAFFRIHITKQSTVIDATGNYTSCLGEIELYGYESSNATQGEINVNKYALRMNPGETDWLYLTNGIKKSNHTVTYSSSDTSVVTVDSDGTVHSNKTGSAAVTLKDETDGKQYQVPVTVDDFKVKDNFQIVAFIPLFYEKDIQEKTFDNLKKGGITDVELNFALSRNAITYENNLKTIQYCYERGLDVTVSEADFNGTSWPGKTDEQILDFVKRYSHLPGVTAYYVTDEPANAVPYARPIALIKSVMPNAVAHMNFCGAYDGIVTALQNELVSKYGQSLDYVMYDAYVFRSAACAESTLYTQLAYNREIGQRLGVNTATYIQSMAWNGCNRPDANAIRYQVYASLAAGVKQISYFCWQTPQANAAETYGPAVIDIDGNPTDLFEPVSKINAAVQKLGPTLMKLETQKVWCTGENFGAGYELLPAGFFITPSDWGQKLCVSYMTETSTGRPYSMLVNRDYMNAAAVSFTADDSIKTLYCVSTETGELTALTPVDGRYTVSLEAGEGILLTADESYRFEMKNVTNYYFLEKAIDEADSLDMTKYREDGQDAFKKALEKAKEILSDKSSEQNAVDKAINNLQKAQSDLRLYAAEGVNLALGKSVRCDNSYEDGTYFSTNYLTDGQNVDLPVSTHAGWSVNPYSKIQRNTPVDIVIDLERDYVINTVVMRPCIYNSGSSTPTDFDIQVSSDNKNWTTVKQVEGLSMEEAIDQYWSIDPTQGRYLRIHITKHSPVTDTGTGGALSQIGEIEVYGAEVGDTKTEDEPQPSAATEPQPSADTEPKPSADAEPQPSADAETSKKGSSSVLPVIIAVVCIVLAASIFGLFKIKSIKAKKK